MSLKPETSHIVSVQQLRERLGGGERVVLLDVRFQPKEPGYGRKVYEQGHLPGAAFIDFKADLTDPAETHGGRSPLPAPDRLAEHFGRLGIDRGTSVVAYEDGNGPAAARLWWVLKYLGVEQVQVLDGGYKAWTEAGLPISTEPLTGIESRQFVPAPQVDWLAGVEEVRLVSDSLTTDGITAARLVDSRDAAQYAGRDGGFDPVAGHIPGAKHYFWKDSALDEAGAWKSPQQLQEQFAELPKESEIIVYCGSGISATPNVLALREAGYAKVKLYAGSWSDWISYEENPIAIGE